MEQVKMKTYSVNEVLKDLFCGSVAAIAGTTASHPIDTIRIRLQLQDSRNKTYNGIIDWGKKIIKHEGLSGLYKGVVPPVVFNCPVFAALFAGKEFGNRILEKTGDFDKDTKSIISGCIGGAISTIITCPVELLKIRSQGNMKEKTNYTKLAAKLVREQGLNSLYKGYMWTLIRDVPAFAVYFGIFEIGCHRILKPDFSASKVFAIQAGLAVASGIGSWLVTYPFDIVKTMIQTADSPLSIRKAYRDWYKGHGIKFFFKGMGATSIKAIPMEATVMILYTHLRERI